MVGKQWVKSGGMHRWAVKASTATWLILAYCLGEGTEQCQWYCKAKGREAESYAIRKDNNKRRAGGPCCQMKNMNFPRAGELHRRAGWQVALQDWPVGCTLRGAGGLHIKLCCGKGRSGGLPISAARPFSQPAAPLLCAARWPALLSCLLCSPADSSRFSFGNMALQPARPAGPPISVIH